MNRKFSWASLFSDFQSREVDTEDLEEIIVETVEKEFPDDSIEELNYTDDGVEVILESGEIIEIEVDWNEIILS